MGPWLTVFAYGTSYFSAVIFISYAEQTTSVYNGLSRLFYMAFDLPYEVCIVGVAAVACIYVVLGGYRATVRSATRDRASSCPSPSSRCYQPTAPWARQSKRSRPLRDRRRRGGGSLTSLLGPDYSSPSQLCTTG